MEEKENSYSPTGVLEDYFRTEDSERVFPRASTSEFENQKSTKGSSRWQALLEMLKMKSKKPLPAMHPLSVMKLSKRFSNSMREYICTAMNPLVDGDLRPQWKIFSLSELQHASNYFSKDNLIGKGGYAEVYKGTLRDGLIIAIKRLTRGQNEDRIGDFLSEVGIMAHVNHPNTAKLIGYGIEGGMFLVLEFSPRGSLASMLHHGAKEKLIWSIRYNVALGTAEGLLYLHECCRRRIIHRDIKAANILLSADFEPQICDFGLAKWLPEQWTHHTVTKFEGTFGRIGFAIQRGLAAQFVARLSYSRGYLAPEYLMHGIVDEKTDVFAFGVLLLELITGRRALDYSKQSLVIWAKPLLKKNKIRELVDASLGDDYNLIQMKLMVLTAYLCIQQSAIRRPRMRQVLRLLIGSRRSFELVKKYQKSSYWKRYYVEIFTAEDHLSANRDF